MESLYRKENETVKYYEYRPSQDWEHLNKLKIDNKEYTLNLTYKSILKLLKLFSTSFELKYKISKGLEILGIPDVENKEVVLDEIIKYIFNTKQNTVGDRVFDLEHDFKYYYTDFKKLGIDLNKDNISWFEFDILLEGIFLQENSAIGKVIQYRTYEKPPKNHKTSEEKEHKFYMEKKRQYALPNPKLVEDSLEKLWKYTEKKAGDDINE